ncbi:hypothetical protein HELRODRAFT_125297, partial [Helobdella robusta]|uniref:C2H2-type domain-containing protein n=1 Tax=Helobdella robusta TaxID=6412 RepID=T1EH54_HELRO
FQCKTCHKKLSSAYSLKQHTRKHTGDWLVDIYKCKKCLYAVKSKKLLEEHIKNRHNPNKPRNHICDVCGKGFIVCNQLKRHLLMHTGQKDFRCPYCSYATYVSHNLKKHCMNRHA